MSTTTGWREARVVGPEPAGYGTRRPSTRPGAARHGLSASSVQAVVFFFQAEVGIRGLTVTGVQTCALPIFPSGFRMRSPKAAPVQAGTLRRIPSERSEERRVGKECGSGWSPFYQ